MSDKRGTTAVERYRAELIQVAAVAVAMVQTLDKGSTSIDGNVDGAVHQMSILDEIISERYSQERKWGVQAHAPAKWLAILAEEVGEIATEVLEIGAEDAGLCAIALKTEDVGYYARRYLDALPVKVPA